MRTTIRCNEQLLAAAKQRAHETGKTLTAVIEDALRESLARRPRGDTHKRVRLTTVGGKGLKPGVDLDDSAGLLDLMEGPDGSH